jgi:hypothetical protein
VPRPVDDIMLFNTYAHRVVLTVTAERHDTVGVFGDSDHGTVVVHLTYRDVIGLTGSCKQGEHVLAAFQLAETYLRVCKRPATPGLLRVCAVRVSLVRLPFKGNLR